MKSNWLLTVIAVEMFSSVVQEPSAAVPMSPFTNNANFCSHLGHGNEQNSVTPDPRGAWCDQQYEQKNHLFHLKIDHI